MSESVPSQDDLPPTVRDAAAGIPPTRRDEALPATRRDDLPPTRRDNATGGPIPPGHGLPPSLADRYAVVRVMHQLGAEAILYEVESRDDRQHYVAKVYHPGVTQKREIPQRLRTADAKHVVRLYDYGSSGGQAYEILEFVPLGSLSDLIKHEGPTLDSQTVRVIVKELAEALDHVHKLNIIHRDIKPGNVLVRSRKPLDLVLTDFGIASVTDASVRYTESDHRTPWYHATETFGNEIRPESDFWSLGMILYEVLVGEPFFYHFGSNLRAVLGYLTTKSIDLSRVPPQWVQLCHWLLRRDPKERWRKDEVLRWLKGDKTLPPPRAEASPAPGCRPYRFEGHEYATPAELAGALAEHWDEACADLEDNLIGLWVRDDLRDQELSRFVIELGAVPSDRKNIKDTVDGTGVKLTLDGKLFRFITRFAPQLPPSILGYPLDQDGIMRVIADCATSGHGTDRAVRAMECLYGQGVLQFYAHTTGQTEFSQLEERWRRACDEFQSLVRQAEQAGATAGRARVTPEARAALLLGQFRQGKAELQRQASQSWTESSRRCKWFAALGNPQTASVASLVAMRLLASDAEAFAAARERADRVRQRELSDYLIPLTCAGIAMLFGVAVVRCFFQSISCVPFSPGHYIAWSDGPVAWGRTIGAIAGAIAGIVVPIYYLTRETSSGVVNVLQRLFAGILGCSFGLIAGYLVGMCVGMLVALLITGILPILVGAASGLAGGTFVALAVQRRGNTASFRDGGIAGAVIGSFGAIIAWAAGSQMLASSLPILPVFAWGGYGIGRATIQAMPPVGKQLLWWCLAAILLVGVAIFAPTAVTCVMGVLALAAGVTLVLRQQRPHHAIGAVACCVAGALGVAVGTLFPFREPVAPPAPAEQHSFQSSAVVQPRAPKVVVPNNLPTIPGLIAFVSRRDGDKGIYVMKSDGSSIRGLSRPSGKDYDPVWSPDGRRLLFRSDRDKWGEYFVMDSDGGNIRKIVDRREFDPTEPPCWSPDGKAILIDSGSSRDEAVHKNAGLYLYDVATARRSRIADPPEVATLARYIHLAWSPDGARIAFRTYESRSDNRSGYTRIWIMKPDGTDAIPLTDELWIDNGPWWTRDSRSLVFTIHEGFEDNKWKGKLCVVNVTTKSITKTEPLAVAPVTPGERLAENARVNDFKPAPGNSGRCALSDGWHVYITNFDGRGWSTPCQIDFATHPSWSPDGTKVMFASSGTGQHPQVYMADTDGGNIVRLTPTVRRESPRDSWARTGRPGSEADDISPSSENSAPTWGGYAN